MRHLVGHDGSVPATSLDPVMERELRAAPFTYAEVGQSAGSPPPGYAAFRRTTTLTTRDSLAVTAALFGWEVQSRSGIRIAASSDRIEEGSVALMRIGPGPFAVSAPCRVVYVINQPTRQGFAYGTLPGHPESGEESFVLELAADGAIAFTISAFSRPATALAKASGPLGRAIQRMMTSRYYLHALDKP